MKSEAEELKQLVTEGADALSAKSKKERFGKQGWDSLKSSPLNEVLREYKDVLPDDIPAELPQDKGVQHEIDLVPGTKYCVTRHWPLPREQVKAIDDFFKSRRKAGQVRGSKSPHEGAGRVPHRSCLQQAERCDGPDACDRYTSHGGKHSERHALGVARDAAGTKEWPCEFNRCVTHLLSSVRDFAPSYFDDVFIHSRTVNGKSDVEITAYALTQVRVINEWPTPSNVKELRQFLDLATYLCKYVSNYAGKIRPLSQILKKDAAWDWTAECQQAFDAVKQGLTEAPILAVVDQDRPFHVVCDASDFAIACASMQHDHKGCGRVVYINRVS
ncbi:unnamed protein product [Phytophthora fragariaefolia]|uniref:Unnamed protein product n=1 Tax=Phytophthora fragariaefolia TaxID=1490495 RepID=A0A9W7D5W3_9STRA|nr:unnamed protein product [Phytophthora fragariaefolia]